MVIGMKSSIYHGHICAHAARRRVCMMNYKGKGNTGKNKRNSHKDGVTASSIQTHTLTSILYLIAEDLKELH